MNDELISAEKLRQLQLSELEIFKAIKEICERCGLRYYLSSGTLLGAVRHGGFIPWDDDMDVCMPRADYDRFRDIAARELPDDFFCIDYRDRDTNDLSVGTMLKVASKNVKAVRLRGDGTTKTTDNAWVDVFPLDGLPNSKFGRKLYGYRLKLSKRMLSMAIWKDVGIAAQKTTAKKIMASLIKFLHLPQILRLDRKTRRAKLDRLLETYSFDKSEYCVNMLGDYELREICPTAMYGEPDTMMFEGVEASVPHDPDGILKILYGDYMKLPPPESRVCKHCIDIVTEKV